MTRIVCTEFTAGRRFLGRLPRGGDLLASIETFCRSHNVETASFTVNGAVNRCTCGVYDQKQQVYVTHTQLGSLELAACQGNVSLLEDEPSVCMHAFLCDPQGKTFGGRLFTPTTVYAGEIDLLELKGPPLHRRYDAETGRMQWV